MESGTHPFNPGLEIHRAFQPVPGRIRQGAQNSRTRPMTPEQVRTLIQSAGEQSIDLLPNIPLAPAQTWVRAERALISLRHAGALPNAFGNETGNEAAGQVWARLSDIKTQCLANLPAGELARAERCLQALDRQDLIRQTAEMLEPYAHFQRVKTRWEAAHRREQEIAAYKKLSGAAILELCLLTFAVLTLRLGYAATSAYLILWVAAGCGLGLLAFGRLEACRPHDLDATERAYRQAYQAARVSDETFWKKVRDAFDGIPDAARLQDAWDEEQEIVQSLF